MTAYTIKPLETAIAHSTGGRNGHSETEDGSVSVNLSVRKGMGGPGLPNTTTPEHLFAAGYAACFGGALDFVAWQHKARLLRRHRHLQGLRRPARGRRFWYRGENESDVADLPTAELRKLVEEAHENICPYSHATRGNIAFHLDVQGA